MAGALAVGVDLAAVGVDDRAGDGQADAAVPAAVGVGAGGVDAVEALEDPLPQLAWDASPLSLTDSCTRPSGVAVAVAVAAASTRPLGGDQL